MLRSRSMLHLSFVEIRFLTTGQFYDQMIRKSKTSPAVLKTPLSIQNYNIFDKIYDIVFNFYYYKM